MLHRLKWFGVGFLWCVALGLAIALPILFSGSLFASRGDFFPGLAGMSYAFVFFVGSIGLGSFAGLVVALAAPAGRSASPQLHTALRWTMPVLFISILATATIFVVHRRSQQQTGAAEHAADYFPTTAQAHVAEDGTSMEVVVPLKGSRLGSYWIDWELTDKETGKVVFKESRLVSISGPEDATITKKLDYEEVRSSLGIPAVDEARADLSGRLLSARIKFDRYEGGRPVTRAGDEMLTSLKIPGYESEPLSQGTPNYFHPVSASVNRTEDLKRAELVITFSGTYRSNYVIYWRLTDNDTGIVLAEEPPHTVAITENSDWIIRHPLDYGDIRKALSVPEIHDRTLAVFVRSKYYKEALADRPDSEWTGKLILPGEPAR